MTRYQQSEAIFMTKSRVNEALIKRFCDRSCVLIPPSFSPPEACTLKQVDQKNSLNIAIYTSSHPLFKNTPLIQKTMDTLSSLYKKTYVFNWILLNENDSLKNLPSIDLFLDLSTYQPYGLMALEAMSKGAAVIQPKNGIGKEFVKDKRNGRLVDSRRFQECLLVLKKLIEDTNKRQSIQQRAQIDCYAFSPEYAVKELLNHLL
jgi:glycosyltransferase involved in cell wall biosynthesis